MYKCDLVLLAMGFLGPERVIVKELDLDCDPRSNIRTPKDQYKTCVDKVYAAGDCRSAIIIANSYSLSLIRCVSHLSLHSE